MLYDDKMYMANKRVHNPVSGCYAPVAKPAYELPG